ncbi:glutathione-dependent reductase [Devosia pacifica]|uniref:Glutathione-dependent reductase n=1 Tax=Devosia pacifica TaxID=1335967 RepID=A0A918VPK6_9HYPH|nr:glutathione S-transferase family protein [Devosia pacifica]GHA17450.1 glutathione-dependent reductase [Devosia pacifica]
MGQLIDGVWSDQWYDTDKTGGKFERSKSAFRNWVTRDGSAGPSGDAGFKAEADRYHLYVSLACPWAHRTLIFRKLKQLEDLIPVSIVSPKMPDETGWSFKTDEGSTGDPLFGKDFLHQIYTEAMSDYTGRVTVPVLWDKHNGTIVSNESAEIIRMFNSAFNELTGNSEDYYPADLRERIDEVNARVYDNINNGVYKSGFATTQQAYEDAATSLFDALDWVEDILGQSPYLAGDRITEADWRLFTTLVRFDAVYFGHFKCNRRRIADYPNILRLTRELYAIEGVAETVDLQHIQTHYYWSHTTINPHRIVPIGPSREELGFIV